MLNFKLEELKSDSNFILTAGCDCLAVDFIQMYPCGSVLSSDWRFSFFSEFPNLDIILELRKEGRKMAMEERFCRQVERPQKQMDVIECGKNECCQREV